MIQLIPMLMWSIHCHGDHKVILLCLSHLFVELSAKLDRRYDARIKKEGNTMAKNIRKIEPASDTPPPPGVLAWSEAQTGTPVGL